MKPCKGKIRAKKESIISLKPQQTRHCQIIIVGTRGRKGKEAMTTVKVQQFSILFGILDICSKVCRYGINNFFWLKSFNVLSFLTSQI